MSPRALRRFGISRAALPPGSEILFDDVSVFARYRWQILTAVGLYLVLSSNDISWSVWIYVAIWAGTTAVAAGVIKLAGVWVERCALPAKSR